MTPEEQVAEDEVEKILFVLKEIYKNPVKFKREKNSPIVVSQDGKIMELEPFSVPDSLDSGDSSCK